MFEIWSRHIYVYKTLLEISNIAKCLKFPLLHLYTNITNLKSMKIKRGNDH